jgi:hypothetical protein
MKYLKQFEETVRSGVFVVSVGTCEQEYPGIKRVNKIDSIGKQNNHIGARANLGIPTDRYLQKLRKGDLPSGAENIARAPWPPRPPELASWPIALRERWGVHSAELEILGMAFPASERRAFEWVKGETRARSSLGKQPSPVAP